MRTGAALMLIATVAAGQTPNLPGMPGGDRSNRSAMPGLGGMQGLPSLPNMPGLDGLPFNIPGLGGGGGQQPEQPAPPPEPSEEALAEIEAKQFEPLSLVSLGLGWLGEERYPDAAAAFKALRELHPRMSALALYNEGCVHYASGDRALAEQYFQRALAEPNARQIHRLSTFNLGSIRLDRVANRRDEVLPGLDPIRNALQAGPERAWNAYAGAVGRSIEDLSIASAMFRAALQADANDTDAMENLRYARSQIVELRRERESKRAEFEQFLTEIIQPQEALQKIMDLTERQERLATQTDGAERLRSSERAERVGEILRDQSRVTAETEDLLRRLDAMARRSDELFGEQNPLMAGMFDQLLGTGADAIADAVGAQRWADFELRGDELEAAEDLQWQAHEDLRSIIEDFAAQVEDLQELMEMFAEQMEQQIQQAEQEFEGQDPEQMEERPGPGELDPEQMRPGGEGGEEVAREILTKENRDTSRRDEFMRERQRDRGGNDW